MDIKTLKPLHGWRAFAGEVGVVVLGVLLALGAQQLVETIQLRKEMAAFRRTIDHEIGLTLFAYEVRSRSGACNRQRIADLKKWLKESRSNVLPQLRPTGPLTLMPYRSAWENRNADVFNALPAKVRQKYAEFYDELDNNHVQTDREQAAWSALARFALPGPVSLSDRREMLGQLQIAQGQEVIWEPNIEVSRKIARDLGIKPIRPDNIPPELDKWLSRCRPIFTPAGE